MERISIGERANWVEFADECEFTIHHIDGELYWDERNAYKFTLKEVEDNIETPTENLISMCYDAVEYVVNVKPEYLTKLGIPAQYHEAIRESWRYADRDLYGRFDFTYDGVNPAKMLEFNADTPTSLYEGAVFQWYWMEQCRELGKIPADSDQFNSIHERLIEAWKVIGKGNKTIHFSGFLENPEDELTVRYMADTAYQAGYEVVMLDLKDIGLNKETNWFIDLDGNEIKVLFKLYPLECFFHDDFGPALIETPTRIIEPLWKSILSNKGILPILWELFPNHPNLLESYFADDEKAATLKDFVKKPLMSREGANITINEGDIITATDGDYGEEGYIVQKIAMLPKFGEDYALIGSWVVAGNPAGMGIREDKSKITGNCSRYVPHFISG